MAKGTKKRKSYADEMKYDFSPKAKSTIWTIIIVLLVLLVFYCISVKATGRKLFNFKQKETPEEVEFQYSEILVGTSFNYGDDYYVIYYDKTDTESEDFSKVDGISSSATYTLDKDVYTCDLGSAFNKPYVVEGEPNRNPSNASEMTFNGPTLIHFVNGGIETYITGADAIVDYINSFENNE